MYLLSNISTFHISVLFLSFLSTMCTMGVNHPGSSVFVWLAGAGSDLIASRWSGSGGHVIFWTNGPSRILELHCANIDPLPLKRGSFFGVVVGILLSRKCPAPSQSPLVGFSGEQAQRPILRTLRTLRSSRPPDRVQHELDLVHWMGLANWQSW